MVGQEQLMYERRGTAGWITFNRSEKRNAWTSELVTQFAERLRQADSDPEVRAVVVTGEGPAFCAGMDLDEAAAMDSPGFREYYSRLVALYDVLRGLTKPTIARVGGDAYGDGLCCLECFDIIVAIRTARLALREVNVGLHAGGLFLFDLSRARAMELSLTGRVFTAEDAERWGMFTRVVDDQSDLDKVVDEYVATFESLPPSALAYNKRSLNLVLAGAGYDAGRRVIRELNQMLFEQPGQVERLAAFIATFRARH